MYIGSSILGNWRNVDDKTRNITRLAILQENGSYTIQSWGASGKGESDQGKVVLYLVGDNVLDTDFKYGFATWNHGFMKDHAILRTNMSQLTMEIISVFKDDSGRSNYRSVERFEQTE